MPATRRGFERIRHGQAGDRLRRLAWFLDSSIPLPGTKFRIGADSLIGLIPGIGDVIGALLSSYILAEAARLNVPGTVLIRMGLNVLVDTLVGMIPILGDFFDMAWKANQRNIRLLEQYTLQPEKVKASSNWVAAAMAVALIVVIVLVAVLGFMLLRAVWVAITT